MFLQSGVFLLSSGKQTINTVIVSLDVWGEISLSLLFKQSETSLLLQGITTSNGVSHCVKHDEENEEDNAKKS